MYLNHGGGEPRFGPDWENPQPEYSIFVSGLDPSKPAVLSDANTVGFPGKLSALPPGDYDAQAVIDRNLGGRSIGSSPGNLYSKVVSIHLGANSSELFSFVCDSVVQDKPFVDTDHVKEFKIQSHLLTDFYHRATFIKGAVVLPDAYLQNPNRKFPVLYEVPGFGGSSDDLSGYNRATDSMTTKGGTPFVYVMLDPNVPTGHCVFADSANNGPWGQALTAEFIPALEKKFRAIGKPGARFVKGHSSGGWSSLWLQIAYPDFFGGVWSTAPDPVDFHQFQLVDIYNPGANMFNDEQGQPIPLARDGGKPIIFTKPFSDMERPIRGEQLGSFEAVFSPADSNGQPKMLWNRDSGVVDQVVAKEWQKYDIDRKLRAEWPTIGPKLKGKIHVFCGDVDTFYLDGAVKLLKAEMTELGSDAEVQLVPGNHFTMMTPELRKKIGAEMVASFKANYPGL